MKVIIIGAGCVGLSIAYKLLDKFPGDQILVIDRYNSPSKGTSEKNSGVLHAGLYYPPNSEKSKLCINGHEKLKELCYINNLPINQCGKLLIPTNKNELENLLKIYENAISCKRGVSLIDYSQAKKIQPNVQKADIYLWSPKTSIFSPKSILNYFYMKLLDEGVQFINDKSEKIDKSKNQIITCNNDKLQFSYLFNCAGAGALNIYQKTTISKSSLSILPILGQYGIIPNKNILKTNLYPVPDPKLPFLGIHLTPLINKDILIGPNAIPIYKKDSQGIDFNDLMSLFPTFLNHTKLFTSNSQNYRNHALNELTFNVRNKFKNEISKFIDINEKELKKIYMSPNLYGIRPQLYDSKKNELVNDFLYEVENNIVHIINAVSPAFTSCLALAEKIINMVI